jgi:cobalt/nickel transport system permease protein
MHMANELLSVPVAAGTLGVAGGVVAVLCARIKDAMSSQKTVLMGVLGAFVFAAQMVNFPLPLVAGTSGHIVGAVLLAILLGPAAAVVVMSSIIIVQCLIFQDGGLLALGCNIINMGIIPCFIGYCIWLTGKGKGEEKSEIRDLKFEIGKQKECNKSACAGTSVRQYFVIVLACVVGVEAGAAMASRVLAVPISTFMAVMLGVHLAIGLVEGVLTAAVLGYLGRVRPEVLRVAPAGQVNYRKAIIGLGIAAVVVAGGLSLIASKLPDGLDHVCVQRVHENSHGAAATASTIQSHTAIMPDYSLRGSDAAGWTSFAGVSGAGIVMTLIWLGGKIAGNRKPLPGNR